MYQQQIQQLTELIQNKQYSVALKELNKLKLTATNELLKLQLKQLEHNINTLRQLQEFEL